MRINEVIQRALADQSVEASILEREYFRHAADKHRIATRMEQARDSEHLGRWFDAPALAPPCTYARYKVCHSASDVQRPAATG
jgi:hypothetical protein